MIATAQRFAQDRRGNVALMFSLLAVPLVFAVGMSIDYGTAASLQSKLNAAADSAVLAAVTPAMMNQSDAASKLAAQNMFNAQVVGVPRLIYDPSKLAITITDVGVKRLVNVAYSAQSNS